MTVRISHGEWFVLLSGAARDRLHAGHVASHPFSLSRMVLLPYYTTVRFNLKKKKKACLNTCAGTTEILTVTRHVCCDRQTPKQVLVVLPWDLHSLSGYMRALDMYVYVCRRQRVVVRWNKSSKGSSWRIRSVLDRASQHHALIRATSCQCRESRKACERNIIDRWGCFRHDHAWNSSTGPRAADERPMHDRPATMATGCYRNLLKKQVKPYRYRTSHHQGAYRKQKKTEKENKKRAKD